MVGPNTDSVIGNAQHQLVQVIFSRVSYAQVILVEMNEHCDEGGALVAVHERVVAADPERKSSGVTEWLGILQGVALPRMLTIDCGLKQPLASHAHLANWISAGSEVSHELLVDAHDFVDA
jgi:hypothetical protein